MGTNNFDVLEKLFVTFMTLECVGRILYSPCVRLVRKSAHLARLLVLLGMLSLWPFRRGVR